MPSRAPTARAREWGQLLEVLDARRSALVLVTGPAGSGRGHLMRRFADVAASEGFQVAGGAAAESIVIEPTTKLTDVLRILAAVLAEPRPEEVPSPRGSIAHRLLHAVSDSLRDEDAVFSLVEAHAPLLICIDGYEPSSTLSLWFVSRLLPRMRNLGQPVLILVADRPERVADLRASAQLILELGEMDAEVVGTHLRSITRHAARPLTEEEVRSYAAAAASDPSMLKAFEAVLGLLPSARGSHG